MESRSEETCVLVIQTLKNAPKMIDFALEDLDSPGLVGENLFQSSYSSRFT